MERPQKRIKLMNQIDPSIPPEDGSSPFLESDDVAAFAIFSRLAEDEKKKMQRELVCTKFKSHIENRSSWEWETVSQKHWKLKLSADAQFGKMLINGFKFSFEEAPAALGKLLDRITVKELILDKMADVPEKVLFGLSHEIAKHKDFVNLKSVQFVEFDSGVISTAIATCGLENVTKIECGHWDKSIHIDTIPLHFYSILLCCPKLTTFTLIIRDVLPVWERLSSALANCPNISTLTIHGKFEHETNLSHQTAVDFAHSCSSTFPKLTFFLFWPTVDEFEPSEFLDGLSDQLLSQMTSFGISLDPEMPSHRQCLKVICHRFPKLTELSISSSAGFTTENVLDAIGNIFENYGRPDIYDFKFTVFTENCAEVIHKLLKKKWNIFHDEFAKIEGENGTWKCIKDNVRITLDVEDFELK